MAAYGGYKLYESGKLNNLINKGSKKTDTMLQSLKDVKVTEINRIKIDTTPISTISTKTSNRRISVSDLTEGTKLIEQMKKNGSNISKEIKNNQWMTKSMDELEKNIKNLRSINDKRRNLGMAVDDTTLGKMELAYLAKRIGELR